MISNCLCCGNKLICSNELITIDKFARCCDISYYDESIGRSIKIDEKYMHLEYYFEPNMTDIYEDTGPEDCYIGSIVGDDLFKTDAQKCKNKLEKILILL